MKSENACSCIGCSQFPIFPHSKFDSCLRRAEGLMTCFLSARSAHNLGKNFIYREIAVLESNFHFEIKN